MWRKPSCIRSTCHWNGAIAVHGGMHLLLSIYPDSYQRRCAYAFLHTRSFYAPLGKFIPNMCVPEHSTLCTFKLHIWVKDFARGILRLAISQRAMCSFTKVPHSYAKTLCTGGQSVFRCASQCRGDRHCSLRNTMSAFFYRSVYSIKDPSELKCKTPDMEISVAPGAGAAEYATFYDLSANITKIAPMSQQVTLSRANRK